MPPPESSPPPFIVNRANRTERAKVWKLRRLRDESPRREGKQKCECDVRSRDISESNEISPFGARPCSVGVERVFVAATRIGAKNAFAPSTIYILSSVRPTFPLFGRPLFKEKKEMYGSARKPPERRNRSDMNGSTYDSYDVSTSQPTFASQGVPQCYKLRMVNIIGLVSWPNACHIPYLYNLFWLYMLVHTTKRVRMPKIIRMKIVLLFVLCSLKVFYYQKFIRLGAVN